MTTAKFTKIENEVLEALIMIKVSNSERQIAFAFIRKLNGFHKEQDAISISQIMEMTGLSNRTVIDGQKQLERMNILSLVKKGVSKKQASIWKLNRDTLSWQPMKRCSLVKFPTPTSEVLRKKPMNISSHTKESTKEIQKKGFRTLTQFKGEKKSILDDAVSKYPEKDIDKAFSDFVEYCEIKTTNYKNYKLAFYKWVREDRFNQYSKNPGQNLFKQVKQL